MSTPGTARIDVALPPPLPLMQDLNNMVELVDRRTSQGTELFQNDNPERPPVHSVCFFLQTAGKASISLLFVLHPPFGLGSRRADGRRIRLSQLMMRCGQAILRHAKSISACNHAPAKHMIIHTERTYPPNHRRHLNPFSCTVNARWKLAFTHLGFLL